MYRRPHFQHRRRNGNPCGVLVVIIVVLFIFLSNIAIMGNLSPRGFLYIIPSFIFITFICIACSVMRQRQQPMQPIIPSPQTNYPIYQNGQPIVSPPKNIPIHEPTFESHFEVSDSESTQMPYNNPTENTQMSPLEQPLPTGNQKFCVYCGKELEPNARFCASCGSQISK